MILKIDIILTITAHAHFQTLLKPAILATVPVMLGHFAVLVAPACVPHLFPNGTLEKSFASFAAYHSVMTTCKYMKKKRNIYSLLCKIHEA